MRVRVLIKANKNSEAGVMPNEKRLSDRGTFNEELAKAGIMLAGEGLQPSSKGARVRFSGEKRTVIDGPFAETKELIAGFWLWQVKSLDGAVEWIKRCPNPIGTESEIEIRPVFEMEDFGAARLRYPRGGSGRSCMIIQLMPNRSRSWAKRVAKKVSCIGMNTSPPSASAENIRSASASLSAPSDKYALRIGCAFGMSAPISSVPPIEMRACRTASFHSGLI
jgi:hypothetical protein